MFRFTLFILLCTGLIAIKSVEGENQLSDYNSNNHYGQDTTTMQTSEEKEQLSAGHLQPIQSTKHRMDFHEELPINNTTFEYIEINRSNQITAVEVKLPATTKTNDVNVYPNDNNNLLSTLEKYIDNHFEILEKSQNETKNKISEMETKLNVLTTFVRSINSPLINNVTKEVSQIKATFFEIIQSKIKPLESNQSLLYAVINEARTKNSYVHLPLHDCGNTFTIYPNATAKYPPTLGQRYYHNLDCIWLVEGPSSNHVFIIQLLSIYLPSGDYLKVRLDNDVTTEEIELDRKAMNRLFITKTNKFQFHFTSDYKDSGLGFEIKWTAIKAEDACKGSRYARINCGQSGISKTNCEHLGCCWDNTYSDAPNCFFQTTT